MRLIAKPSGEGGREQVISDGSSLGRLDSFDCQEQQESDLKIISISNPKVETGVETQLETWGYDRNLQACSFGMDIFNSPYFEDIDAAFRQELDLSYPTHYPDYFQSFNQRRS